MGILAHLLTNGPPVDRGCLRGVGYFFPVDRGCLRGVGHFFTYFFTFLRENFSRENNFRSRMFVRCGVFFLPWIADVC